MDKVAYFISDAHLGIDPPGSLPHREERLVELLRSWKGTASHVVVVGDLFEFWFEYRDYVSKNHMPLIRALADLVDSGVSVHLFRGNHDFALGDFFEKSVGAHVHDNAVLEIQGKRIYVAHGDGVVKSDWKYRLYRRILDCRVNRRLFGMFHPDWGMALARFVGRSSRNANKDKVVPIDEYLDWGAKVLREKACDICIHGHHHMAGIWKLDGGVVASPGEWIKKFTVLQLENGELSLKDIDCKPSFAAPR